MFDVVALGELLIDFTPAGISDAGNVLFERNPGGAPANVLAAVSKLGGKSAFIGMVGKDQFGHFLKEVLESNAIDASGLKFSDKADTTLAFVHLDEKGDRSFSFYRRPGADTMLTKADLELEVIKNAKIFHFGSLSMTGEPARSATLKAVRYAKESGALISYDPNWRPPLWENDDAAKEGMALGLQYADILKISEVELAFLTGQTDLDKGSKMLFDMGIKLVVVTLGAKGCYYRCAAGTGQLDTYDTKVADTTGAGDSFMGALLYHLSGFKGTLDTMSRPVLEKIIDFSNAVGALCAAKKGAIPAMPSMEEVRYCINSIPKLKAGD